MRTVRKLNRRELLAGLGAGVTVAATGLSIPAVMAKPAVESLSGFDVEVLYPFRSIEGVTAMQDELNAMRSKLLEHFLYLGER